MWLPVPAGYDRPPPSDRFPDPLRKEQGSRIAGATVGPLFPWYFGLQAGCSLVALATALAWLGRRGERVQRLRVALLTAALVCVGFGWWLERKVEGLRVSRNDQTDAVLASSTPSPAEVARAEEARRAFGIWHGYSLLDNFATLILVSVGMALTAQLPAAAASRSEEHKPQLLDVASPKT
jgi:hypothetical protein